MPLTPDSSRGPLRASPKFALRSYLYITLHYVFAKPLALLRVVLDEFGAPFVSPELQANAV